jgi:predicted MPP superfamily phosphohydrolase
MLRWLLAIPVLALVAAIVVAAHLYVIERMVVDAGLAAPWSGLARATVWTGLAALVLQPIGERWLPHRVDRWIAWPAATWMGLLFWLLIGLGVTDGLVRLGGGVAFAAIDAGRGAGAGHDLGAARAGLVGAVVLLAACVAYREARRGPRDVRVEIELARWPRVLDGYRIVQISDIHIGATLDRRFARALTERVNALEPDLVAVTGDLVDGRRAALEAEVAPFGGLRGRDGVFFVTGNHDFYSGADTWVDCVEGLGMCALRNEHRTIERDGGAFVLAGVDDHHGGLIPGQGGEDLGRALEGVAADRPIVLLAHDPSTFKRAHAMGIDLQLSGHTHGGQIWPFHWLVRMAIPFVAGRYRRGDAELYVSRGTGYWGPPMRLGSPAEITEIVLRAPGTAARS